MKRLHSDQYHQNQNSFSSAAAEAVASIDDLLLEIFGRLRLKPLVRFKSGGTPWPPTLGSISCGTSGRTHPSAITMGYRDRFACVVPFDKSDPPFYLQEFPETASAYNTKLISMWQSCNGLLISTNCRSGKGRIGMELCIGFPKMLTLIRSVSIPTKRMMTRCCGYIHRCVDGCNYYFGESSGHLHYLHNNVGKGGVTVYEMRTDYSEWFVKHKFRVDVRSRKLVFIHYFFRAEKQEDCFVVLWDDNRLLRQNILSETSQTMMPNGDTTHMFPYFESICLV